ncbi:hypothetical protein TRM7557_03116 [Tritonibacter multivorans]|uniref:Uncharacterized protein n=1 Tax=Tritonibacter multivorans TaxID=928856 RepID=A0A0P1GH46_9RHOB|nr:hypothetical protein [Tritonibacter multivorans]MDA7422754.1 hypothetical protein [Tritonibacter multivorans]CUH80874.1 hypothetical protein TRM7557_03116 [Tritonibacter multivorans]SFD57039.1 hypothetical protein SAMN04488049_11664 [Tritonibacter multivorans]
MKHNLFVGNTALATGILAFVLSAPAVGQQTGGVTTEFTLSQGFEVQSNPTLAPDNDDVRSVLNTDLGFSIASVTRRSDIKLGIGARARYAFGDLDEDEKGFDFGRENANLSYRYTGQNFTLSANLRYLQDDVSFLDFEDLITVDDSGAIIVDEDATEISGSGTRRNTSYRLSAQFYQDQRFGWGASVSGSDLTYSDVTSASLEDTSSRNAALNAHFEFTPAVRLDSRLSHTTRDTEGATEGTTNALSLSLQAVRSDVFTLRSGLAFADPDTSASRTTATIGAQLRPTAQSQLTFDIGGTVSDDFDTELEARLNYRVQPTRQSAFEVSLNSGITENNDNDPVRSTVGTIGYDLALTSLSRLSLDMFFVDENVLATDTTTGETSARIQYSRQLNKDWMLAVGANYINRRETGQSNASSEELFVNVSRAWSGRRP